MSEASGLSMGSLCRMTLLAQAISVAAFGGWCWTGSWCDALRWQAGEMM